MLILLIRIIIKPRILQYTLYNVQCICTLYTVYIYIYIYILFHQLIDIYIQQIISINTIVTLFKNTTLFYNEFLYVSFRLCCMYTVFPYQFFLLCTLSIVPNLYKRYTLSIIHSLHYKLIIVYNLFLASLYLNIYIYR